MVTPMAAAAASDEISVLKMSRRCSFEVHSAGYRECMPGIITPLQGHFGSF